MLLGCFPEAFMDTLVTKLEEKAPVQWLVLYSFSSGCCLSWELGAGF